MTDIDRTADIEVSRGFAQVTVRIPLTGHVNQEWVSAFTNLARMWAAHEGSVFPGLTQVIAMILDSWLPVSAASLPSDRARDGHGLATCVRPS